MTQPMLSRRPDAPGSPLDSDAVRLKAMWLRYGAPGAPVGAIAASDQTPSAQYLRDLGAEIRKLSATILSR